MYSYQDNNILSVFEAPDNDPGYQISRNCPLSTIDKVTIIDGNGEGSGVGSMGSYVPQVLAKTMESVKEVTGIDIADIMRANTYDAKVNKNVNITGLDGIKVEAPAEAGTSVDTTVE